MLVVLPLPWGGQGLPVLPWGQADDGRAQAEEDQVRALHSCWD
jgi:hypothetical protein